MSLQESLELVLRDKLKPAHLEVIDESHMHSSRETHFKAVIVSAGFVNLSKVKRQQMVYSLIEHFFKIGLHAFSQVTLTPDEWSAQAAIAPSPVCAHSTKRCKT